MSGNRSVPCSSSKILSVFVGDVLSLTVLVALGETEIDDKDGISWMLSSTNEEIIRLNVTMNDPLFMYFLHMAHKLDSNQKNSF